ncbi:endo-1,4-beta-xylanase [Rubripirellula amarantea]|uniref:Beta-xylanase n=1 Tax=Rubripirellula amarantea TaxID=2527999 RepID=A0A5C5WH76_9BACT|nr:endo-1,4-beta-xylanase [Rubripirellula amarantea]MDA8743194.1 endo-1,4-beta-xylanase [Rubripirellula amarantea]TWT49459.1 Endo-1,4-beta-xylanase Z precursor [Rubripirellula amarantea]
MRTTIVSLCLLLASLAVPPLSLVKAAELPEGGVPLISTEKTGIDQLNVRLGDGEFGTYERGEVQHETFKRSLRIELTTQPDNTWDTAFGMPATASVQKGDVILVGFWMRGSAANGVGGAVAEFVFEKFSNPYTKSIQFLAETPSDGSWQEYWVRFRSLEDYDVGQAGFNFQVGYQPEVLEIAGLQAWNYGKDFDVDSLPNTELTYAGRSSDAAWRTDASKRIEKHRKRDFSLQLSDATGKPYSGAKVHVKHHRHAFDFGSAVSAPMLAGDGEDNDRFRDTFEQYFNAGTIENGLKWQSLDQEWIPRESVFKALRWMKSKRIPARGHVMVWPGYRNLPNWIPSIIDKPEVLSKVLDMHIREVGYATQGLVRDWDVLNEVFDNTEVTAALGDEAMIHWFKVAREVAPTADLYYNDYAGLVRGGFPTTHKVHFEDTVRYLKENGAPIDGIGIQGHFGGLLTPPERLVAELDRWHSLGLKVLITEYDVEVPGDTLKADFTRDFMTVCFSHPAVVGVLTWGFWEGAHWKPEAALFAKDWTPTAMGKEWVRLTKDEWTTQENLVADADGQIRFRGFLGEYIVTVNGKQLTVLGNEDGTMEIIDIESED